MRDSQLAIISVPQIVTPLPAGSTVPSRVCQAGDCPLRVVLRNVSFGGSVFVSFDKPSLQALPPGSTAYELPAGASDTFVLAPNQTLYAASPAVGAQLTYHTSEMIGPAPGFERHEA